MARTGIPMQITAVDSEHNLFHVQDVFSSKLVDQILATPWQDIAWQEHIPGQFRPRRKIQNSALPWIKEWDAACEKLWPTLETILHTKLLVYHGTAWWLDEPNYINELHTDGNLPGAMQLFWVGALPTLGTAFYHYKNSDCIRHQFIMAPNSGYIMLNPADSNGFKKLLWHGMLTPVPQNTFRVTSYICLTPQ